MSTSTLCGGGGNRAAALETRWMLRGDWDEVLAIERASFPSPWTAEDFRRVLRQRHVLAHVAIDQHGAVVGYCVAIHHPDRFELINLAVAPDERRAGVGGALLERLASRLTPQRRREITAAVRESNLDAQLFFRAAGFRARAILRACFDNDEDAYLMRYTLGRVRDVVVD